MNKIKIDNNELLLIEQDSNIEYTFTPQNVTLSSNSGSYNGFLVYGEWIPEINKSGMLVFNYTLSNKNGENNNDTRWGYYGKMMGGDYARSDNGLFVSFELYINTMSGTPVFGSVLLSAVGVYEFGDASYWLVCPLPANPVIYSSSIFVAKGDSVLFGVREIVHFYYTSTINSRTVESSNAKLRLDAEPVVY